MHTLVYFDKVVNIVKDVYASNNLLHDKIKPLFLGLIKRGKANAVISHLYQDPTKDIY